MCDIAFEKAKGYGEMVNRSSDYAEEAAQRGSIESVLRKIQACARVSFLISLTL